MADALNPELYAVLGVDRSASSHEITSAYRRLVRELHPDSRSGDRAPDAARLAAVLAAYQVLGDPHRRAAYDAARCVPTGPAPRGGVPIPVRRVNADSPGSPGAYLRVGPVRFDPQAPPGLHSDPATISAHPAEVMRLVAALLRHWGGATSRPCGTRGRLRSGGATDGRGTNDGPGSTR